MGSLMKKGLSRKKRLNKDSEFLNLFVANLLICQQNNIAG